MHHHINGTEWQPNLGVVVLSKRCKVVVIYLLITTIDLIQPLAVCIAATATLTFCEDDSTS
eukprot:scaffold12258_cov158-Skeletonema_menzelii.AAC.5